MNWARGWCVGCFRQKFNIDFPLPRIWNRKCSQRVFFVEFEQKFASNEHETGPACLRICSQTKETRRRSKWIALEIKEYNNHDLPLSHTNRNECQRRTAHDRAPLPPKGHARVFPFSISGFDRVSMNTNVHINLLRFPFYAHCARWSLSAGESRWKNREENGWGIVGIDCCSAYSVPLCA